MKLILSNKDIKTAVESLHHGNETGLKFFYHKFYDYFFFRAHRATDDECTGESIVQEAFLRLWLFRENVSSESDILEFLKSQVRSAIRAFYQKSRNRFHRSLLRLDSIEDYQEFMLGYELEEEQEEDIVYLEQLEAEKKKKLERLHAVLPNLNTDQQLFIRLCLKHSFNYERIAYYMGGISDYEVGLRVEKTIDLLRTILNSEEKMQLIAKPAEFSLNGEMTEEEAEVFRMRYELQYSFDKISEALQLNGGQVRTLFINAHAKIKSTKKNGINQINNDMATDTMVLTRKVQVFVECEDKEKRSEYFKQLFEWQDIVFRGANMVLTHQYVQENLKDLVYLQNDVKVKLADRAKDSEGILNTSRMNTTYRLLSGYFKGRIPSDILSQMNASLIKYFQADRLSYWKGEKSLRNYKKDMPIPFSGRQLNLSKDENNRDFKFTLFKIPFRTYLGKDRSDKRVLLQRALVGQIKICSSAIKIVKGKIFLLLALELPKKIKELKDNIIAEASLSIEHPIAVTIGKESFQIGNKEEFTYRRMAIQAARHRLQKAAAFDKGGRGRKRKLKSLEHFNDKEKNYVNAKLHLYSRRLIELCVRTQAGTLLLVNQSNKEEIAKKDQFLLRNWSYYGLIEKIKYKARMVGINLIVE